MHFLCVGSEGNAGVASDGKAEVGVADFIKTAFCVYTSMHACFLRCLTYHSAEETAWLRVVWGSSWLPIGLANLLLHESCLEGLLNGMTIFDNVYFIFAVLFASFVVCTCVIRRLYACVFLWKY